MRNVWFVTVAILGLLGLPGCGTGSSGNPSSSCRAGTVAVGDACVAPDAGLDSEVAQDAASTDAGPRQDGAVGTDGAFPDALPDSNLIVIPDAGAVLQPFSINSIVPNRGDAVGGTPVRIIGTGFKSDAHFLFANTDECTDLVVENQNRATCKTPPGMVGPVDILAQQPTSDPFAEPGTMEQVQLTNGFTFFENVSLTSVTPSRIPLRGGVQLTLHGTGLVEGTRVHIGGVEGTDAAYVAPDTMTIFAPPGVAGPADVDVMNFNGSDSMARAVFYYEVLDLDAVAPGAGPLAGGNDVTLIGTGLIEASQVTIGGLAAAVTSASDDHTHLTVTAPAGAHVGPVEVAVTNDNGDANLPNSYVYFDAAAQGLAVVGIAPAAGPVEGGTTVFIAGSGFGNDTSATIGGQPADCDRVDANVLRCTTPPGEIGTSEVVVSSGGHDAIVDGGYTYYESLEILAVRPDQGAIAGGTFVSLTGRGFVDGMSIEFGGVPLADLQVVNDGRATGHTPPNTAGPVDVRALTPFARTTLPSGYTYFDPITQFGGVWGDPIRGAVNVTCLHAQTGAPLEEVAVLALADAGDVHVEGLTNAQGQVVLSEEGLLGPLNLTAAKEGFEVTTIEDVAASNITIYLTPNTSEMGPPPPGVQPAVLRGTVTGLDVLPKPDRESVVNVIVVETTHDTPYNRSKLPPPGPGGMLFEDGPFEIVARPGELAIVATAGELDRSILQQYQNGELDYWTMRQSLVPASMGLRRFISASPGIQLDGLDVTLDHPMDLEIPVDLDNPPAGGDTGPQVYAVLARLNLGSEGYWELDTQGVALDPALTLGHMPHIDGWDQDITYYFFGLAVSSTATQQPMSITIEETRDIENGLEIGPFVGAPFYITPLDGSALDGDRLIDWDVYDGFDGPITAPHGNLISIEEPGLVPKPLWRHVTPSLVTQYNLPELPMAAGSAGLSDGPMYLTVIPFIVDGQFNFDDFTYEELSQYRWKAWAVNTEVFLP